MPDATPSSDHPQDTVLQRLLAGAETVLRIQPGDLIVVSGMDSTAAELGGNALLARLSEAGVPTGGVILLGPGCSVDTIDMQALARMDARARETTQGATVAGAVSAPVTVTVGCPRCDEALPIDVCVELVTTDSGLMAQGRAEQTEAASHALSCRNFQQTQ